MKNLSQGNNRLQEKNYFIWQNDVATKPFEKEIQDVKTAKEKQSKEGLNTNEQYNAAKKFLKESYEKAKSSDLNYKKAFQDALDSITKDNPALKTEILSWINADEINEQMEIFEAAFDYPDLFQDTENARKYVKALQVICTKLGLDIGNSGPKKDGIDGFYATLFNKNGVLRANLKSSKTAKAVGKIQEWLGVIPADKKFGKDTLAKLKEKMMEFVLEKESSIQPVAAKTVTPSPIAEEKPQNPVGKNPDISSDNKADAKEINENFVEQICTPTEAVRFAKEGRTHDKNGKRIIYYVEAKAFSLPESNVSVEKQFVAFHGTGSKQGTPDNLADSSAVHTLASTADAAYLITKKGLIIRFFDDKKGFGGLDGKTVRSKGLPEDMNKKTIGVEMTLNDVRVNGKVKGVENPNDAQIKAAREIRDKLVQENNLDPKNILTHFDVVKGAYGAHVDDIKDEKIRAQIGIPPRKATQGFISDLIVQNKNTNLLSSNSTLPE